MSDWSPNVLTNALPFAVAAIVFLVFAWRAAGRSRQLFALRKEELISALAVQKKSIALCREGVADRKKILDTLLEIKLALKGERN